MLFAARTIEPVLIVTAIYLGAAFLPLVCAGAGRAGGRFT
jgi:hypothetical protein